MKFYMTIPEISLVLIAIGVWILTISSVLRRSRSRELKKLQEELEILQRDRLSILNRKSRKEIEDKAYLSGVESMREAAAWEVEKNASTGIHHHMLARRIRVMSPPRGGRD